jgi:hypothetical protein
MDFLRTLKKRKPKQRVTTSVSTPSPAGWGKAKMQARGGAKLLKVGRVK